MSVPKVFCDEKFQQDEKFLGEKFLGEKFLERISLVFLCVPPCPLWFKL
jgi:hypothetical protein